MSAALVALLMVQQLHGTATVDRTDPMVGDVVALTVRVESAASEPVRIGTPILSGLEVRGTQEESRVSVRDGVPTRVTTRRIQLAATQAGPAVVGAIRIRQGGESFDTDPVTLQVLPVSPVSAARLDPRVRTVLERLAPPAGEEAVTVGVVTVPESVVLGEQLDVVVAAWFPREIRRQLRMPPTLTSPELEGAWLYRQHTPPGIAASRRIASQWYDLFVAHVVAFPLLPGAMSVGPATAAYDLPVTFSFLTRELRHVVQSESLTVVVLDQPRAGRPGDFSGPAAEDLRFTVVAEPRDVAVGEAATVTVELSGRGNVSLWPEPELEWPVGVRVYPLDPQVEVTPVDGWVAGAKRFRYLVLPDSIGAHVIPAPSLDYYDSGRARYVRLRADPVQLVARAGQGAVARATPPPLARSNPSPLAGLPQVPGWAVALLLVLPPMGFCVQRFLLARPLRRRMPTEVRRSQLEQLERDFREAMSHLVPVERQRDTAELANALRAAGVETTLAEHTARVRERLGRALYGPDGASDPDELAAEVRSTLDALTGRDPSNASRLRGAAAMVVLFSTGLAGSVDAQSPSAESLFERGAFYAAADSFSARIAANPLSARDWYNLGSAAYRLRNDTRAQAAWVRAARLAPRDRRIARALGSLPPADPESAQLLRITDLTPAEMTLVALVLWGVGWVLLTVRAGRKTAAVVLVLAAGFGGLAWRTRMHYAVPLALVRTSDTPLRAAPYGPARPQVVLSRGSAVVVERVSGSWVLAERGGVRGWLLNRELEGL